MDQLEIIKSKKSFSLHANGFLFYKRVGEIGGRINWKCKKCGIPARTDGGPENLRAVDIPTDQDHDHPPDIGK